MAGKKPSSYLPLTLKNSSISFNGQHGHTAGKTKSMQADVTDTTEDNTSSEQLEYKG